MCGGECLVDSVEQANLDGFEIDRIAQAGGEGSDGRLGVIAPSIEAAIHKPLHAAA